MATTNPFNLLVDDDHEDPSLLVAAQQPKVAPVKKAAASPAVVSSQSAKPAKLPSKPLPPAVAVREAKTESGRGYGCGGGQGFGRGVSRGGFSHDSESNENHFRKSSGFSGVSRLPEDGDSEKPSERRGSGGPRGPYRGGFRGGLSNGEAGDGDRPRRMYERHTGTGRGNEFKRDGAGRANWGSPIDDISLEAGEPVVENHKNTGADKQEVDDETVDVSEVNPVKEPEENDPKDKEMTLEEYEKVLEEKRKVLMSLKMEERKVDADKEFVSMQQLSSKKDNDDIFIKLGSEKDKRKDFSDKEDKAKKPVNVNLLKPAEVERYYSPTGRRGRGVVQELDLVEVLQLIDNLHRSRIQASFLHCVISEILSINIFASHIVEFLLLMYHSLILSGFTNGDLKNFTLPIICCKWPDHMHQF